MSYTSYEIVNYHNIPLMYSKIGGVISTPSLVNGRVVVEQNAIGFHDYQGCFAPYSELDNIIKNYIEEVADIYAFDFCLDTKELVFSNETNLGTGFVGSISIRIDSKGSINFWDSRDKAPNIRVNKENIWVRSTWEANLVLLFTNKDIAFQYERETFPLLESQIKKNFYIPDFFLSDNRIVEVKGFWDSVSVNICYMFQEKHREYNLLFIDYDMYYTLDQIYANKISGWRKNTLKRHSSNIIKIVGVNRKERQSAVKKISISDDVFLKRDQQNAYDTNAIMVCNRCDEIIGYIAKEWALIYAQKIDMGMTFTAKVKQKEQNYIDIEVTRENFDKIILHDFLI